AGLHDADAAAAIPVADHLAHQHGAGRPFAAEAEPVQCSQHEELFEILRKGAEKREDRIPQDRELAEAVIHSLKITHHPSHQLSAAWQRSVASAQSWSRAA